MGSRARSTRFHRVYGAVDSLRQLGVLTHLQTERGSAPVDALFSIVVLMFFTLGVIGFALALYGRNVLIASAHEGARAALERGANVDEAVAVARETVRRAAGGFIDGLRVSVAVGNSVERQHLRVTASGRISVLGPVEIPLSVTAAASATREATVP